MMVRLDRALACRTLIFAAFLLWPLILFGRPTYLMGDSLAYLKTGQQAVEFAESKISSRVPGPAPTSAVDSVGHPDPAPAARGADTKTARSVTYSVAAYALRWPGQDLTALAAVQVLAVSILCAIIGSVTSQNTWCGRAPRSMAASSSCGFRSCSRACTTTAA